MKPHIIMHMMSSVDGRITTRNWPEIDGFGDIYEEVHRQLKGDAWIVGRVTMAEFAKGDPRPVETSETFPRQSWKAPGVTAGPYAIAVDQAGKLHLNISHANGDPLIAVLTEAVSENHLAELQRDRISYIFAGAEQLDLPLAVHILAREFSIERLLLEGGGGINGSFLSVGLIDEVSLLIMPLADGTSGPTTFDRPDALAAPLDLISVKALENGILHVRYSVRHGS